ncbi:phosphatidylserine decarboxylase 1 [Coemansia guatemalensis]|uniref:Phosphatidylserine decarboxylase proenzyme 1, mitochondrial n=1 Tax=Coemansia guatemalensis TaxID=2761395 RepID=A0A9W8I1H8_9FUNG|nr:phosphatidylserine decarboxylase 1 [Coemansia guatemalensis]
MISNAGRGMLRRSLARSVLTTRGGLSAAGIQPYNYAPRPYIPARLYSSNSSNDHDNKDAANSETDGAQGSNKSKTKPETTRWYWIPVGVGLAVIGFQRLYHIESDLSKEQQQQQITRGVTVPGPWHLHVLSALPLKAMSRLFGSFNEIEIPRVLRKPLLHVYAWIFGCNLSEMKDPDLSHYPNLSAFFYRELCPEARPVDMDEGALVVSPSDGRILHYGVVEQREVEQVKGLTYSLDAFFGKADDPAVAAAISSPDTDEQGDIGDATMVEAVLSHSHNAAADDEFAVVNGIPYTLDTMIGSADALKPAAQSLGNHLRDHECLYFCVIYLAPGDYHRFHSPANWVVEARRHFAGELYSVSPYIARTIQNLFVLNERVALLGRWKHGFMSMTAVGATNVGSVVVNFDRGLRTNLREKKLEPGEFSQLEYKALSPRLAGVPLRKGQEVGGFRLGSTVVLVFSAPHTFKFCISPEQRVKMGQALGHIPSSEALP